MSSVIGQFCAAMGGHRRTDRPSGAIYVQRFRPTHQAMMNTPLRVSGHTLWLDAAGILHVRTDETRDVDLEVAKALVAALAGIAGNRRRPLLCDLRAVRTMNRDARAYFSGPATECWSATALLIDSPLTRAVANFFMGLNKPRVPTKMFGTANEAESWLQAYAA